MPPRLMLNGMKLAALAPVRRRAMCGMINPTQPTMPATEITTAVIATAAASKSVRSRPTETPSEKAVSSSNREQVEPPAHEVDDHQPKEHHREDVEQGLPGD